MYHASSIIIIAFYNFHRLVLLACSIILILIAVFKDFCRRESIENPNSILFVNSSMSTHLNKRKIERQLLYETAFVCFWKTIDIIFDTIYSQTKTSYITSSVMAVIMDASLFISNVGGLIALLFMSSVSRSGFKQAFSVEKDGRSISFSTRFSMVKRSMSLK